MERIRPPNKYEQWHGANFPKPPPSYANNYNYVVSPVVLNFLHRALNQGTNLIPSPDTRIIHTPIITPIQWNMDTLTAL